MKTLLSISKTAAAILVGLIFVGFFVAGQMEIRNTYLTINPTNNVAKTFMLLTEERNRLISEGKPTDVEVGIPKVQDLVLNLNPEIDGRLNKDTIFYIEGTYDNYCAVSYNVTPFESEMNTVIRDSNDFSVNVVGSSSPNCDADILDRAKTYGIYVGSEGGVALA